MLKVSVICRDSLKVACEIGGSGGIKEQTPFAPLSESVKYESIPSQKGLLAKKP